MIFAKVGNISKWQRRFLKVLFATIFAMRGRINFTNLARFAPLHEQTFRRHFGKFFDWVAFNRAILDLALASSDAPELVGAIDCTFVSKAGRKTYGLDRFWSSTDGKSRRGLEVSVLALVHSESGEAFTIDATQTPPDLSKGGEDKTNTYSRIDFYLEQVEDCLGRLSSVRYVVADGHYAKTKVLTALRERQKHLVTRLRSDSNLRFLYTGPPKKGPGAPKQYDGKVDFCDLSRFDYQGRLADKPQVGIYTKELNSPHFKRDFRVVVLRDLEVGSYVVLASTDTEQEAEEVVRFYRLRFQIELLFRKAKQFAGFGHCQARSQEKLDFHFNATLAAINVSRLEILLYHRRLSLNSYVRRAYNRWLIGRLLSKLRLLARIDLNHPKVQQVVRLGSMAS